MGVFLSDTSCTANLLEVQYFSLLFLQKIFSSLVKNILQNLNRVKVHGGHFQHQMVCIFPQQCYVTGNPDLVCVNNMDKMG